MDASFLIFCGFVAVVAALGLLVIAAVRARKIEQSASQYRAHELRVVRARLRAVAFVCGVLVDWFCLLGTKWSGIGAGAAAVTVVVCLACVALPVAAAEGPVLAAYARVRGVRVGAVSPSPRILAGILLLLVVLGAPLFAASRAGYSALITAVLLVAVCLVAWPLLIGILAPVLAWSRGARPLPAEVQQRLSELSARAGVAVRGRVVAGREGKVANAAQLGWVPGLRYVLVTDYLLDESAPAEVDAALAHELGHVRHQDLRWLLLSYCLFVAALNLVIQEAVAARSFAVLVDLGAFAAIFVVLWVLRARLIPREFAADDFAVAAVGPQVVLGMLERLTELNAIKPDSSRSWDRRVAHPGMARRLARVRAAAEAAQVEPASPGT